MRIRCIIIEDQPPAQRILQKYIDDVETLELKGTFPDALSALPFLQQNAIDLIFLDIHLPKMSGMDFLKTLKDSPKVILTTAFSEFALESYEYNVVDYLLKPFSFQRFVKAITKASLEPSKSPTEVSKQIDVKKDSIFIKSGHDLYKVSLQDILYLKADMDYVQIVTKEKNYLNSETLKHWLGLLDETTFFQVHKSYIVNSNFIKKISGNLVYIGDEKIPIGRAYKEDFKKRLL